MKSTALLDALSTRVMFVMYRVEPRADGKTDKIPSHPLTGKGYPDDPKRQHGIDGQNPSQWMLPHTALAWAAQWNLAKPPGVLFYGVGLVIYEGCGIAFIDLDGCRDTNGGWMPHVLNFESRFPGAYRETSFSGTGRHIFCSYANIKPVHGTRNKLYKMEAYTKARFAALTGDEAEGSVFADCTVPLAAFLGEFFPEHPEPEHGVEWTSAPVAEWKGPQDSEQLIAKAIRSVSPRAVFGAGAAFGGLWMANSEILARAFPPQSSHQTWGYSEADQALANHLAFWTGNDCERMWRLMQKSKLRRDKWERFETYIKPTILDACGTQHEWYIEKTAPVVDQPTQGSR